MGPQLWIIHVGVVSYCYELHIHSYPFDIRTTGLPTTLGLSACGLKSEPNLCADGGDFSFTVRDVTISTLRATTTFGSFKDSFLGPSIMTVRTFGRNGTFTLLVAPQLIIKVHRYVICIIYMMDCTQIYWHIRKDLRLISHVTLWCESPKGRHF